MTKVVDEEFERLIGQGVRHARKRMRVTQKELALHLGITPQQVQKAEVGKNRISASRLLRISLILDEPIDSLLKDASRELVGCSKETKGVHKLNPEVWKLAQQIAAISDRDVRNDFMDLVRSVLRICRRMEQP